ncbi:MAG: hypothetical protein IPK16_00250 [Anaerolineales bacterium]|nr:hypothetical protein [Anaerolineales bacterium]
MALGQDFSKVWRVSNSGNCAWEPDFALAYVNGNRAEARMGGQPVLVGRRVLPGEVIDLTAYLRAPQTYGTFQGFWQMRDSAGQYFGEVVWVGIQVPDPNPPPPPPPATINPNLRADTNYVNAGQCTNIRWDVDNVSAVYFIDGGNVQGVGGHDTRSVCPYQTTTYTLRVVANGGASSDFPITINVGGGGNAPYSINFWADRTDIDRGQCTTLRWDVQNVNAVYLDNEGVPGVSSREVCPGSSHTYKLKVVKRDGGVGRARGAHQCQDVQPQQNNPKIEEFSVNTNQIRIGQCVNFNWRTRDAAGVNFYRSGMALLQGGPTQGGIQDCPDAPGNYDYTLDAYGAGNVSQTVTVQVSPVQPR